ncbi:hypothetical protein SPAN111604_09530 [Sphingomonas antarctica]|uniref:PEPxxWA-CTERM sorting domain-containing protein n=1 Tax=Sphingomonas antarctica TaxID=2040274 RepID=UPI0039EA243E
MRIAIIAAALAVAGSTAAQATTVLSENFNSTAFRGAFLQNDTTDRFGSSPLYYSANAAGWTFSDGYAGGFPHVLIATNVTGTDGAVWLQEVGSSASRTLSGLTAGKTYTVSFLQSGDNVPGANWNYNVAIDGGTIYAGSGQTQAPGTNPGQQIMTSFVASGGTAVLSFTDATTASGGNVVFDNVSVTGVPEAATWAMMIAGFGIAGVTMRRRRAQVRVTYA